MTKFSNHKARRGFTLIELLIVIGLLGALTALVLPAMMADREDALGNVCDYNQAGTVRVLKQFQQITGKLPNGMHSGLKLGGTEAMDGLPSAQADNFAATGTIDTLTQEEADALNGIGITQIAYDEGLNYEPVEEGTPVVVCTNLWQNDSGSSDPDEYEYSFDGENIDALTGRGMTKCVVTWIAPTTAWEAGKGGNKDWGGGNVSVGLDLEGQCPIPAEGIDGEPDFSYYMAYIGVFEPGAALLVDGVLPSSGTDAHFPGDAVDSLDNAKDAAASHAAGEGYFTANSLTTPVTDADSMTWTSTTDVFGNAVHTAIGYESDGGTPAVVEAEHTYTITVHPNGEARLLGTSCPECGIMNP